MNETTLSTSPPRPAAMLTALKKGYLKKEGGSHKTIKTRYFVLNNAALSYYKDESVRLLSLLFFLIKKLFVKKQKVMFFLLISLFILINFPSPNFSV
jgi:hypothetical protein